ncbi:hypothetical protein AA313_de0203078 [Arthrobotrys entomopaga]|nr:hypothetical protein AA313_de0203078 [Arthrobotrys entomopaga]
MGFEKGIVGFWAETQLFGGVVHFDRGNNGNEIRDVYIHPNNKKQNLYKVAANAIPNLITNLSNDQFDSATSLLNPSEYTIPLPEAQERGIYRIKDLANSYIYRPPPTFLLSCGFPRCVVDAEEEFKDAVWSPELLNSKPLVITEEEKRQWAQRWENLRRNGSK